MLLLKFLPSMLLTRIYPAIANSVDPDQLASEANWSKYQQSGLSNLIGWKLEMGMSF